MITVHLTETEIQLYMADKESSDAKLVSHIEICPFCQSRVKNYELLFNAITVADKPAFDFDLSLLVMESLPAPKSSFSWVMAVLVPLLSLGVLAIAILLFWSPLVLLIAGTSGIVFVLSGAVALVIFGFQARELLNDYQKRMDILLIQQ